MSCLQLQYIQICFLLTVTVHYHIDVQLSIRQGSVYRAFHLFYIYIYAISTDPNLYEAFSKPVPIRFLANPEGFEFLRAWCLYPCLMTDLSDTTLFGHVTEINMKCDDVTDLTPGVVKLDDLVTET